MDIDDNIYYWNIDILSQHNLVGTLKTASWRMNRLLQITFDNETFQH